MKFRTSTAVAVCALAAAISTSGAWAAGGSTATGADLQLSGSASTGSPDAGAGFSYTYTVKNSGPDAATTSVLADTLPAGVVPTSATVNGSAGPCSIVGQSVSCALGTLANTTSAKVVINATAPASPASYTNVAAVSSAVTDPNAGNNTVSIAIAVKAPNTGKAVCTPLATSAASAGYVTGGMYLTATYSLDPCTSRASVRVKVVNASNGVTEYTIVDPGTDLVTGLNTLTYTLPAFSTVYRVDYVVTDKKNGGLYQTASIPVTTPAAVANCATITKNNLTSGYWLTYAAIWESYTATNCGYGRQRVEIRITNLASGAVVYDAGWWGMDGLLDYEGAVVQYDTDYQFDVEVHGYFGELLDAQSQVIRSMPLR